MALQDEVERQRGVIERARGGLEPASNEASGVLAQRDDCVARPSIMVIEGHVWGSLVEWLVGVMAECSEAGAILAEDGVGAFPGPDR
jgi:hypothetical protein